MKQQILDLNNQNRIRLRIIRLQSHLKDKEYWLKFIMLQF